MPLRITAPTHPQLADSYRRLGLWTQTPLRAGVEQIAEHAPDRPAVIDNEGTWTYQELRDHVEAGVGTLLGAGLAAGDAVVIVAPNSRETVAAILATIRADGAAVIIDRRCGALDLANAIASSGARLVVLPDELRDSLRVAAHPVKAVSLSAIGSGAPVADWSEPDPAQPRLVVFTSGTTRRSKGVIHTLETIGASCRNLAQSLSFREDDRPFLSSPLATMTGLSQLLLSLQGASICLEDRFDAALSLERIEQCRATVIGGAPVILEILFAEYDRQQRTGSSLQRIALGGTNIPRTVLEVAIDRFGIRPTRVYGSSEACCHTFTSDTDSLEQRLYDDGGPAPGSEVRLGDAYAGGHELQLRGPNLFQGYLFEADNAGALTDGWFRTGDLVELSNGRMRVLGRLKDVVARKGIKISLAEVDDAGSSVEGVTEAAAYAVPDEETGEHVALALHVSSPDVAVSYDSVVARLRDYGLARGKLPEEVVVWHEPLPRNASGKVVRAQLREQSGTKWRDCAPRLAAAGSETRRE
jgi:acyl-CoA synthetase (AMP-forming)/AMP-acid ligase II